MSSILVNTHDTAIVALEKNSTAVTSIASGATISITKESTVVVEKTNNQVVLTGLLGPPGISAIPEDDMVYSKRIDFVTDNELYRGEALVGTAETSSLWRIRKITIGVDGDVSELWANGNANFDKVWANRSTLNYS